MKIEIDPAKIADALHEYEDRNASYLDGEANHHLANVLDGIAEIGKPGDPLVEFICRYGLWILGLADNPLDDMCHVRLDPGEHCGECGAVNVDNGT